METKQINKISFMVVALVTIFLSTEVGLALPKSSPDVLIREAEGFMQEKDYTKALATVKKLLANYSDHPDTVECIDSIGHIYRRIKNAKAIELYQYFLSNYPSHSWAIEAQSGLAKYYIQVKDDSKAQAAVKKLLANYSDHPDIVKVIGDVAYRYGKQKDDRAIEWYQYIVSKHPSHNLAVRAQSGLAICYMKKNEDVKAQAAVKKLLANYSDYPDSAECIGAVAGSYRSKKYDRAVELYQYIFSKYPSHDWVKQARSDNDIIEVFAVLAASYQKKTTNRAIELYRYILSDHFSDHRRVRKYKMDAQYRLARIYVNRKDDPKAEAAVEKLLANYSDRSKIAEYIVRIAESYPREYYDRAVKLYQYFLSNYPSHNQAIQAQSDLAICYIHQKEDAKAQVAVEKLLANYSDHPGIVGCIARVAKKYLRGKRAIELHQFILSNYPSHDRARQAQSGLAICYIHQMENAKAFAAIEKLLVDYSSHPNIATNIKDVLSHFHVMGNGDQVKKYIFDKLIDGERSFQVQKIGLLHFIKHFSSTTALDAFNRIIPELSKDPSCLTILNEIADSCHELQKDAIAVDIYQIYLSDYAIEADKEKIKIKLFESMYAAGADPEKILIELEEYIGRNKATDVNLAASAIALRGRIFANIGKVDKAISEFLRIKNKYPKAKESLEASYFVGYCYMLQSKFDKAKESFNQIVKDYPESSYASKSKSYLTRIKSMTE